MYACLYRPPDHHDDQRGVNAESRKENSWKILRSSASSAGSALNVVNALVAIAQEFSPRYESRGDVVSIDVRGLERLLGPAQTIGEELRREAARRGVRVHVAVAGTRTTALVLALARPGLTVVDPGGEAEALAPLPIGILEKIDLDRTTINAEHAEHAEKLYKNKTLRALRSLRSNVGA